MWHVSPETDMRRYLIYQVSGKETQSRIGTISGEVSPMDLASHLRPMDEG